MITTTQRRRDSAIRTHLVNKKLAEAVVIVAAVGIVVCSRRLMGFTIPVTVLVTSMGHEVVMLCLGDRLILLRSAR